MIDLDGYFARIGYSGTTEPTLATLNGLALAHVIAIPFENLDVLLGRDIDLELSAIERKLVGARRGGYCFEQNRLFLAALGQLGYTVRPISARVRYGRPREYTPPRTHMFLEVAFDQKYLIDVGIGSMSLTSALVLAEQGRQETTHEPRRLLRENGLIYHQVWFDESGWTDICEFTGEDMPEIDRIVGNWYTSKHPRSSFRAKLQAARATATGRISLLDHQLTIRTPGHVEKHVWTTQAELRELLATRFGLQFSAETEFHWAQ